MCKKKINSSWDIAIPCLIVAIVWTIILIGIKSILNDVSADKLDVYQSVINNLLALGGIMTAAGCSVWSIFSSTKDMKDATTQLTQNANEALSQAKQSDLQTFELARITMALKMIEKMTQILKDEAVKGLTPSLGSSYINLKQYMDAFILYTNKLKTLYPKIDFKKISSVQRLADIDDILQIQRQDFLRGKDPSSLFNLLLEKADDLDRELTEVIGSHIEGFEQIRKNK